jgi:hypothetical protein
VNESMWDYDQRFKILKDQLTFQILNEQHREWFIAVLLLHICYPLMQQKILLELEALEIDMKLGASPIGENGIGMAQV